MIQNGPKWSKMIQNGEKWSKWSKMIKIAKNGQNCQRWSKCSKIIKMVPNDLKWSKMVQSGEKWAKWSKNGQNRQKWSTWSKIVQNDPKWLARRTKSRGPKGLQLKVGAWRAPRLLVYHIFWETSFKEEILLVTLSGHISRICMTHFPRIDSTHIWH